MGIILTRFNQSGLFYSFQRSFLKPEMLCKSINSKLFVEKSITENKAIDTICDSACHIFEHISIWE